MDKMSHIMIMRICDDILFRMYNDTEYTATQALIEIHNIEEMFRFSGFGSDPFASDIIEKLYREFSRIYTNEYNYYSMSG